MALPWTASGCAEAAPCDRACPRGLPKDCLATSARPQRAEARTAWGPGGSL